MRQLIAVMLVAGFAFPVRASDEDVAVALALAAAKRQREQQKEVTPPPPAGKQDPYKLEYREFYEYVRNGGRGVLVVGVADKYVGSYETHCRVSSGFGGLKDGEYDCWSENGKNSVKPRALAVPEVTAPAPFPAGAGVPLVQIVERPFASPAVGQDVRNRAPSRSTSQC